MNPQTSLQGESIWEYPRRPIIRPSSANIEVLHQGTLIAHTHRALKVCENGHPPTFYIPPEDVRMELMEPSDVRTFCEWKGIATYFHLLVENTRLDNVAWTYEEPHRGFESLANYLAFYPQKLDNCRVNQEPVRSEPHAYYGGWITSNITGPFR